MENAPSLNKVSQQTKHTYRFIDLCSPTVLKEKLSPSSIKERSNVVQSNKTANGVFSEVDPRFYRGILYFQNVTSYDGVTHKFEFILGDKESSVFCALISTGLAVTQKTLCPNISYQISENSTINVENMNINLFSPLSAVRFSMLVLL
jgi:hypothetical protein